MIKQISKIVILLVTFLNTPQTQSMIYKNLHQHLLSKNQKVNSALTSCVETLINHYALPDESLAVIYEDESDFTIPALEVTKIIRIGLQKDEDELWKRKRQRKQKEVGLCVVVSNSSVPDVLKRLKWTQDTKFIMVLSSIGNNTKNQVLQQIFQSFWQVRVVNIVVAVPTQSKVVLYTYYPYKENNCYQFMPVAINSWDGELKLLENQFNFFPKKNKNLHGCPVNISVLIKPPGIIRVNDDAFGIEGEIIKEIAKKLNSIPVFKFINISDDDKISNYKVLQKDLITRNSDMGAGLILPVAGNLYVTDHTNYCLTLCVVWVVPIKGKLDNFQVVVFKIFTLSMWLIGIFSVLFSLLFSYFINSWSYYKDSKLKFSDMTFKLFTLIMNKSIRFPYGKPLRLFLVSFLWFSFIMNTVYQAFIGSTTIVPDLPPQLETTQDVIESGLQIEGLRSVMINVFPDMEERVEEEGSDVEVSASDVHEALKKVSNNTSAYLGLRLAVRYESAIVQPKLQHSIYITRKCVILYHPYLALTKNSHLTESVEKIMFGIIESGIKEKLFLGYMGYMKRDHASIKISTDQAILQCGVFILLIGYGIALIAFVIEVTLGMNYHRGKG